GSTQFPLDRRWAAVQKDRSDVLGFGISRSFGKLRLDLNYTYVKSRSRIGYDYGAGIPGVDPALTGDGFPDLRFRQNIAEASLVYPLSRQLALRLLLRHEDGEIRDWHYDGVEANPVPAANQQTYLDAGPSDYRALVVGAFVRFDFGGWRRWPRRSSCVLRRSCSRWRRPPPRPTPSAPESSPPRCAWPVTASTATASRRPFRSWPDCSPS